MKKYILGAIGLVVLNSAYAAEQLTSAYEIVSVMPSSSGVHLQLSPTPSMCTGSWWATQAVIKKEAENYEAIVSAVYSAFVAGKTITAIHYFLDGSGNCSASNQLNIFSFKINR